MSNTYLTIAVCLSILLSLLSSFGKLPFGQVLLFPGLLWAGFFLGMTFQRWKDEEDK